MLWFQLKTIKIKKSLDQFGRRTAGFSLSSFHLYPLNSLNPRTQLPLSSSFLFFLSHVFVVTNTLFCLFVSLSLLFCFPSESPWSFSVCLCRTEEFATLYKSFGHPGADQSDSRTGLFRGGWDSSLTYLSLTYFYSFVMLPINIFT